jgi:hypothetical protein
MVAMNAQLTRNIHMHEGVNTETLSMAGWTRLVRIGLPVGSLQPIRGEACS